MSFSAALQPYNAKLFRAADAIAIATAASLPWSTSATGILVGLWLLFVLPPLDLVGVRRALSQPAVAFALLLVALASLGILWSEASWAQAFEGFTPFAKLL